MHRLTALLTLLTLVLLLFGSITSPATAQGNSEHAKRCQKGGWADLAPSETPTVPFANQDECVSYGAQGGTIVAVQEESIFLTFLATTSPDHCVLEVHLRNFAPNTAYRVTTLNRLASNPSVVGLVGTPQITTDVAGNADQTLFTMFQHDVEAQAETAGVASAWTDVAC